MRRTTYSPRIKRLFRNAANPNILDGRLPFTLESLSSSIVGSTSAVTAGQIAAELSTLGMTIREGTLPTLTGLLPVQLGDLQVLLQQQAAAELASWNYRRTLPGTEMATNFSTSDEVMDYIWRNNYYTADPTRVQWVDANHADAGLRIPGYAGCAKFIKEAQAEGEGAILWHRHLRDSDGQASPMRFWEGFREGETFYVYVRMRIPLYTAESWWDYTSGSGGPKFMIINRVLAANLVGQMYVNNASHRDFFQFSYSAGAGGLGATIPAGNSPCRVGVSDTAYQGRVNLLYPWEHRLGLDPQAGTACERLRRSRGGLNSYSRSDRGDDQYYTVGANGLPMGSDQSSGAMMLRRDAANVWCGLLHRVRVGNWGQSNTQWEVWGHLENEDYRPLAGSNTLNFPGTAEGISCGTNPNAAYTVPSGNGVGGDSPSDLYPYDSPDGVWPFNGLILNGMQNTGQAGNSHHHPSGSHDNPAIYFGEAICNSNVGCPAPGFRAPPNSWYSRPSYISPTAGEIVRLDNVLNGKPTLASTLTGSFDSTEGRKVLSPWSAGCWNYDSSEVWVTGGGHADSRNPGLYRFGFAGEGLPFGWEEVVNMPWADITPNPAGHKYADGHWVAAHTYGGLVYDPGRGRTIRVGGSRYDGGGQASAVLSYDQRLRMFFDHGWPFTGTPGLGIVAVRDWTTNTMLCYSPSNGQYNVLNLSTYSWVHGSPRSTNSNNAAGRSTGAIITISGVTHFIHLGTTNSTNRYIWRFDGSLLTNPITGSTSGGAVITLSGDAAAIAIGSVYAPALTFERERENLWAMNLHNTSPNRSRLYLLQFGSPVTTVSCTYFDLGGTPIASGGSYAGLTLDLPTGGYGKIGYLNRWGAIGILNAGEDAVYVATLPN